MLFGGGEPPTPSVVYLNLERTEYELCGLVRLLIMGKQTLKKCKPLKFRNKKKFSKYLKAKFNIEKGVIE